MVPILGVCWRQATVSVYHPDPGRVMGFSPAADRPGGASLEGAQRENGGATRGRSRGEAEGPPIRSAPRRGRGSVTIDWPFLAAGTLQCDDGQVLELAPSPSMP